MQSKDVIIPIDFVPPFGNKAHSRKLSGRGDGAIMKNSSPFWGNLADNMLALKDCPQKFPLPLKLHFSVNIFWTIFEP